MNVCGMYRSRLRAAAQHMRDAHPYPHPRTMFWATLALTLEEAAQRDEPWAKGQDILYDLATYYLHSLDEEPTT